MKPVVSVKELMHDMIDPIADNIFDAVTWDISKKGVIETKPRNDEDWEKVKVGAVTLAEAPAPRGGAWASDGSIYFQPKSAPGSSSSKRCTARRGRASTCRPPARSTGRRAINWR